MKILKSKLFEMELEKREKEMEDLKGTDSKIEWGSQIRSYVFQPYKMVKDHRTKAEEGNVDKVMDGDINNFINEYLKFYKWIVGFLIYKYIKYMKNVEKY